MSLIAALQFELAGRGNGWTTIDDLTTEPIRMRRGMTGSGPNDRVATTGSLTFSLDNSATNAAGLIGSYSPNHVNKRTGFKLGIGVRLALTPEHAPIAIASSSIDNPTEITTAVAHGLTSGDTVVVAGHAGSTPSINGTYVATVLSPTVFTIPVNVTADGTGGTVTRRNTYYVFSGTLDSIQPSAGLYAGDLQVRCTAVDWMNEAAKMRVTGIPTQLGKRADELFATLVASVPTQPIAIEIQTGSETYPYALDDAQDESDSILTLFQRIASSELGYIYIKGDRSQGGTLVFESRRHRATQTANADNFTDVRQLCALAMAQSRGDVINKLQTISHQRRVDAAATTVLARLENPILVGPNTSITLLMAFRDPDQEAARVGGTDMVAPVSGTDYIANTAADGSGSNVTSSVSVVANYGGNGVRWTVTNNGAAGAYLTLLQARGRGLYGFQNAILEAEDDESQINYGEHASTIDMHYQADPSVASEAAIYVVNLYKDPATQVQSAEFVVPYTDVALLDRLLRRAISDRVGITEQVTGLTTVGNVGSQQVGYFINAIDLTLDGRNTLALSWLLAPADKTAYWLLEVVGRSELDATTVLGFGQIVGHTDVAHCDTHEDVPHDDTLHSDTAHADAAHADALHGDVVHSDAAHADAGHADTAHADGAHADVSHGDTAHSDTLHSDSAHVDTAHADAAHDDAHSDGAHADVAHSDTAHGDTAHDDVAHVDDYQHVDEHGDHDDFAHFDVHDDDVVHSDTAHVDEAHEDAPHADTHTDVAHADVHDDNAHADTAHADAAHADTAHVDTAHADVAHSDGAHADTAHVDTAHDDGAHGDTAHSDSAHADTAHGDTAHADVSHADVSHDDDHCDTAHGDL